MKILVVEDEPNVRKLIQVNLERENLSVTSCDNGEEAIKLFESGSYSLVVLDWMLKGQMTGLDVCKKLSGQVPILMVTARASTTEVVLGLEMGADDYITKPFEVPVLMARVRALLRRANQVKERPSDKIVLDQLEIFVDRVEVLCNQQSVKLTASEFRMLVALARKRGSVMSREALVRELQSEDVTVTERVIDTHVYSVRQKIGPCADVIETIRGIGYRVKA
jgi:DNA-binding response OmpR family regulator